ncbi:MAG TPA: glycosyltransferase family 4 protein [Brevefilum fermentans]|jgi:glycosyltransferase involved in cell wall biosynthesis|nr:glycosyltransferase family 4 protein [Chloroflexota bacterium]HPX95953.1 glycosyltransferase family 4 protein [Brevefilum fermentans]
MKLLLLTLYYPPEIGAPQARLSELATGLKARGFEVQVLTALPSYPKGKIFPDYRGLWKKETISDIPVFRTWVFPTQKTAMLPRLANYFSFVLSSLFFGIWGFKKVDFILTESPPLFLGITGYLLSRLKRAKWIFNISDLWPESAVRLGAVKPGWALTLSEKLEAFIYRKAWLVTGQTKTTINCINARFPEVKLFHLSNGVDTVRFNPKNFRPEIRKSFSPHGDLIFFYGGLHGLAQGLSQILYCAKGAPEGIRFVFIGDGPEKSLLIKLAQELELTNIEFHDAVASEKMPEILASVDVCLIPLKTTLPGAVPSKLYEAMASAKPVILIADGEPAEIVTSAKVGLAVSPGDGQALMNAIKQLSADEKLRTQFGENGRRTAIKLYNRANITEAFAKYIINKA